jgi:WD40 repeat protein
MMTGVNVLLAVKGAGGKWLLAATDDTVVRLWDLDAAAEVQVLRGHTGSVKALCIVGPDEGPHLLASAGDDSTVRLWDPATGAHHRTVSVHYPVEACVAVHDVLVVGLRTGILALRLNPHDGE